MKFSLTAQIEEIDRELELRRRVYPSQVKSRAMTQGAADFHMARLSRVRETLAWLQQHETEIRTIMAGRRKAAGAPLALEILEHAESVEVQFSDGRRSEYFYFDDDAGRRAISGRGTRDQARQQAEALVKTEREN